MEIARNALRQFAGQRPGAQVEAPAEIPVETPPSPETAPMSARAAAIAAAIDSTARADYGETPWETRQAGRDGSEVHEAGGPELAAPATEEFAPPTATAAERAAALGLPPASVAIVNSKSSATHGTAPFVEKILSLAESGDISPADAVGMLDQLGGEDGHILQTGQDTCVAATIQKSLAIMYPERYVQIAADLLKTGRSTLPDGQVLEVSAANRAAIDAAGAKGEVLLDALMQTALMELGNGDAKYDWDTDSSQTEQGKNYKGLNWQSASTMSEAILGIPTLDNYKVIQDFIKSNQTGAPSQATNEPKMEHADFMRQHLQEALRNGNAGVLVPTRTSDNLGQHMVLVTHCMDSTVFYTDALGAAKSMSLAEFAGKAAYATATADGGIGSGSGYGSGWGSYGTRKRPY